MFPGTWDHLMATQSNEMWNLSAPRILNLGTFLQVALKNGVSWPFYPYPYWDVVSHRYKYLNTRKFQYAFYKDLLMSDLYKY